VTKSAHSTTIVGWREWVGLPSAKVPWIKAKLDTGARSSAVHAFDLQVLPPGVDGVETVRFSLRPWQGSDDDTVIVECPIFDRRAVRSSSGHTEQRIVVLMAVMLAGREITAEMTLSNRDTMGFRMLIGREALRQGFIIDPARSFLGGRAPKDVRHVNRGG
jgi:hypothetical protein